MPTRHLSDEQRQRYANFAAAPSPDQLAQYFHLDRSDREVADGLRGDHNRLGFALMLGSARFLGVFPGADVDIPNCVTAFLVDQLGLKKPLGLDGYFDLKNGQRFRHLALIRERYGFTEFADNGPARFRLTRWLYALCWSGDDHPGPLIERAASWLVVNKVLLPGVSVLERSARSHSCVRPAAIAAKGRSGREPGAAGAGCTGGKAVRDRRPSGTAPDGNRGGAVPYARSGSAG
jgi:hypothetical protein